MYLDLIKKSRLENERLEEMEKQVQQWTPPSEEHAGLKKFMLEQIALSKSGTGYYLGALAEVKRKSALDFFAEALGSALCGVESNEQHQKEENVRTAGRNAWIALLRASVNKG